MFYYTVSVFDHLSSAQGNSSARGNSLARGRHCLLNPKHLVMLSTDPISHKTIQLLETNFVSLEDQFLFSDTLVTYGKGPYN